MTHADGRRGGATSAASTENPEEAKKLVAFFGSTECQSLVADKEAVVFPAISELGDQTTDAFAASR